jgi:ribonuclease Z
VSLPDIRAVILTHRHTDHIYGLPMLVQGLWLGGREEGLPLYGPAEALEAAGKLLEILQLADREEIFPIEWHSVPLREGRRVMEIGDVRITSAPGVHAGVQTLALRFDNPVSGRSIVYSSDTEPCPAVRRLAAGANLLIHEATGTHAGHSSPAQAAGVARQAGVEQLALIHYPVQGVNLEAWRRAAGEFSGPVTLAQDGDIYPL